MLSRDPVEREGTQQQWHCNAMSTQHPPLWIEGLRVGPLVGVAMDVPQRDLDAHALGDEQVAHLMEAPQYCCHSRHRNFVNSFKSTVDINEIQHKCLRLPLRASADYTPNIC